MTGAPSGGGRAGGVEALYPALYGSDGADACGAPADLPSVLGEIRRSTVEKLEEIAALRASLARSHADRLTACAADMAGRFLAGGALYAFGNGGSSTDAQDLVRLFTRPPGSGRPLAAVSLAHDVAWLTALSNDVGYEAAFPRRLAALAGSGDIAVALSTSGGSANLLAALAEARRRGLLTVGFAGYDGGAMAEPGVVDHLFVVPSTSVHRIQEAQTTLFHVLWELTQRELAEARDRP